MVIDHLYDEKLINQTDALYNLCLHGCLFHLFRNTAILSEGVNDTSYKPCMLWLSALFPPSYLILFSFLPSSLMYNLFNNTDFFNTVILLSKFYCPPVSSWKKTFGFLSGPCVVCWYCFCLLGSCQQVFFISVLLSWELLRKSLSSKGWSPSSSLVHRHNTVSIHSSEYLTYSSSLHETHLIFVLNAISCITVRYAICLLCSWYLHMDIFSSFFS